MTVTVQTSRRNSETLRGRPTQAEPSNMVAGLLVDQIT